MDGFSNSRLLQGFPDHDPIGSPGLLDFLGLLPPRSSESDHPASSAEWPSWMPLLLREPVQSTDRSRQDLFSSVADTAYPIGAEFAAAGSGAATAAGASDLSAWQDREALIADWEAKRASAARDLEAARLAEERDRRVAVLDARDDYANPLHDRYWNVFSGRGGDFSLEANPDAQGDPPVWEWPFMSHVNA